MKQFETAAQVRAHMKAAGFEMKGVKVRWMNSPFGGAGRFWVEPPDNGELRITVAAPGQPLQYSDELRTKMAAALVDTNARVK
jgi:hypothetical protein